MRRSVVRLIAVKETRDLLRDRRTVLLIVAMPVVLYPLFIGVSLLFAFTMLNQRTTIGISGAEHLPATPALVAGDQFAIGPADPDEAADKIRTFEVVSLSGDPDEAVRNRTVDAALVVSPGFAADFREGKSPTVRIARRDGDEKSKLAARRLNEALAGWTELLRKDRFARAKLPPDFDRVIVVEDPNESKPPLQKASDELRDTFASVFPFILMMWILAGAMQPAVDMTAGEKERGTMETLLISPAERSEIVAGKFLATTAFSFTSVVWNVVWLAGAAFVAQGIGLPIVRLPGMIACVVLGLPLAMLFGAVCIALGVFARSTKEGQYYLLPLLIVALPLAFFSLTPGVELDWSNCWIPVTGAMLLQKQLLSVSADPVPWKFFAPVLLSLAGWVALALGFAIWQFRREGVLFRETGAEAKGRLRRLLQG